MKNQSDKDQDSEFQETVREAFIKHLGEKLDDKEFFSCISKKLGFKFPSYLRGRKHVWKKMSFKKREALLVCC